MKTLFTFIMGLCVACIAVGFALGHAFQDEVEIREVWQTVIVEAAPDMPDTPSTPSFEVLSMPASDLKSELRKYKQCDFRYLDDTYYYTDKETAGELITLIHDSLPSYAAETWDCDDIALFFKVRMAYDYGLNCVGYAEGGHIGFTHAWNVVLTDEGVFAYDLDLNEWVNEDWYDEQFIQF